MLHLFQSFLAKMKSHLARISRATENEVSIEELHSDAWIVAEEVKQKRGREIDFSDPKDQHLILGALNIRNVKRPEKNVRYAARIDAGSDDDEGATNGWADRLHADDSADPLISLLMREAVEAAIDPEILLTNSYSQASAYVRVFRHFKGSRESVCAHLAISSNVLGRRFSAAAETVRTQHSVFDGKERIPANFLPLPGRLYAAKIGDKREAGQWAWNFEDAA